MTPVGQDRMFGNFLGESSLESEMKETTDKRNEAMPLEPEVID